MPTPTFVSLKLDIAFLQLAQIGIMSRSIFMEDTACSDSVCIMAQEHDSCLSCLRLPCSFCECWVQ